MVIEVIVGSIVEVDAITSVLNSQKNSGAVEDVDDKVVIGRWPDSVKSSEIISSILFVTSPALAVVVSENISAMRDFAVSTSVVSAKISEMISLIFPVVVGSVTVTRVEEASVKTGDSVALGCKVVGVRLVEISASVVESCERMLWSVVEIVETSLVMSGRSLISFSPVVVERKASVVGELVRS